MAKKDNLQGFTSTHKVSSQLPKQTTSILEFKKSLFIGGAVVYLGVSYLSYRYFSGKKEEHAKEISRSKHLELFEDNSAVYDTIDDYDSKIGLDELFMGLTFKRKKLIKQAKGDVLEVSVGTARNLSYYTTQVTSLLGIDTSKNMLRGAENNLKSLTNRASYKYLDGKVSFQQMDGRSMTLPSKSFDTVIDTFGLCSTDDPVKVLREMQRVCKKDGKILLLEHGLSRHSWLNNVLDRNAQHHAAHWGCWWNKDILQIVKDSGLVIEEAKRYHFGTTYYIVGSPAKQPQESEASSSN